MSSINRIRGKKPEGIALIAVLVVAGVVASLMLTAMAAAVRTHRQLRVEHQYEQTRRLAVAGTRHWTSPPDADGAVWDAGGAIGGYETATVRWSDHDPRKPKSDDDNEAFVTAEIRSGGPAGVTTRYTLPVAANLNQSDRSNQPVTPEQTLPEQSPREVIEVPSS